MKEQIIKSGDIVRLTDPISNGQIVRIESVDDHGFASWLGGAQYCDMEQIDLIDVNSDLIYYYHSLSELVRHIEEKTGIKLYPESAVLYYKHAAEVETKEHAYFEQACNKEHNKLLNAQDYIKNVCKESSDDIQKLDAENKELRDSNDKLRFSLSERETEIERIKDEHKKEMDEYRAVYFRQNKILVEQNNALKRQLDESNKQIEIYAKKVRNLEAELEEDGGLG